MYVNLDDSQRQTLVHILLLVDLFVILLVLFILAVSFCFVCFAFVSYHLL